MSYNVTRWQTKKLENFRVPLLALTTFTEAQRRRGWGAEVTVTSGALWDRLVTMGIDGAKVA